MIVAVCAPTATRSIRATGVGSIRIYDSGPSALRIRFISLSCVIVQVKVPGIVDGDIFC